MYGFENPFNARIAESSEEAVLTATATREAVEDSYEFIIKQAASGDKFISNSITNDFYVAEANKIINEEFSKMMKFRTDLREIYFKNLDVINNAKVFLPVNLYCHLNSS